MKHKISFEFAARVFTDHLRKEDYDDKHSNTEQDRIKVIGLAENRLLYVIFSEPDSETIRIISARKAKKHERRFYYGNS